MYTHTSRHGFVHTTHDQRCIDRQIDETDPFILWKLTRTVIPRSSFSKNVGWLGLWRIFFINFSRSMVHSCFRFSKAPAMRISGFSMHWFVIWFKIFVISYFIYFSESMRHFRIAIFNVYSQFLYVSELFKQVANVILGFSMQPLSGLCKLLAPTVECRRITLMINDINRNFMVTCGTWYFEYSFICDSPSALRSFGWMRHVTCDF